MTAQAIDDRYGPVVAVISSKSQPDKQYEVRRHMTDGTYSCQCHGYRFRRTCKHVEHCIRHGITSAAASVTVRANLRPTKHGEMTRAEALVHGALNAGGVFATETQRVRMVTWLEERLAMQSQAEYFAAVENTPLNPARTRRIILED